MNDQLNTYLYRGFDKNMLNERTAFIIEAASTNEAADIGHGLFCQTFGYTPYTEGAMLLVDTSGQEVFSVHRIASLYDRWYQYERETDAMHQIEAPAPVGEIVDDSPFGGQ